MGWSEKPGKSSVRTDTDSGPAKLRRRFTSAPSIFQMTFVLADDGTYTGVQKATRLIEFYENGTSASPPGTAGGVERITGLQNPRDDSNATFRFLDPPTITQLSVKVFRASVRLEKI
jgi:hypothetical protein